LIARVITTEEREMEVETDTLPKAASPYDRWEAGELNARDAATAIAQELISEIEPAEQALEARKKARREELGTLLIRVGEPLEVLGRVTRWVEPTTAETANVKKLRALITELRDQGSPALDGIASRIEACITVGERRGYPLIEPPLRPRQGT
jgi:polyhydroxyalkanoate synthesis regulator phasin